MTLPLSQEEILRFSRHLMIPEVGLVGQRKLKNSSVLVVGAGGLGSPVALYLAAAGVGRIGLVDYDTVDSSNLQRQIIHGTHNLGQVKVESARERLLDLNPYMQVDVYLDIISAENARALVNPYDVVVDCSDNFPTRYLLNDVCVLTGKPDVYGSIFRFEGQASVFDARSGPCYRCLFPAPPPPGSVPSCAEGGVFGILPGTIGTIQATETLKLLLGIGSSLAGRLLLYDALEMSFMTVKLKKNPHCNICSDQAVIHELIDYEDFCGSPVNDHGVLTAPNQDMTPQQLAARLQAGESIQLLDVREAVEQQISVLPGAQLIPLGDLASRLNELNPTQPVVLFCRTGVRSQRGLGILAAAGFEHLYNLRGGINAWAQEVDHSMLQY